ncbi:MAG TPA: hypothetical protein VHH11_14015 [Gammaproteobacteria bacterium]|nr:hypothetical protein [Gammaproteobacteria bacterium]
MVATTVQLEINAACELLKSAATRLERAAAATRRPLRGELLDAADGARATAGLLCEALTPPPAARVRGRR